MEIAISSTAASLRETSKLTRKWHFWPRQILGNARAAIYLVAGLFIGGRLIVDGLRQTPVDITSVEKGLLVLVILAGLLYLLYWQRTARARKALAAETPTRLRLENDGLTVVDATGASVFEPWSLYTDFSVRSHVIALTRAGNKGYRAIPIGTLSPSESGQLRSILLSHLPERR